MGTQKLIDCDILRQPEWKSQNRNILMIYSMDKELTLQTEKKNIRLKSNEFALVGTMEKCRITNPHGGWFAVITIDYYECKAMVHGKMLHFSCDPAHKDVYYSHLRDLLRQFINNSFSESTVKTLVDVELSAQIVRCLLEHYAAEPEGEELEDERLAKILDYIETGYNRKISLESAADHLFITPQYLLRYFRGKTGLTFLQYLNNVRLGHALEEMRETDHTITEIAMNNGFPNINSFIKVFQRKYNKKPTDYRREMLVNAAEQVQDDDSGELRSLLEESLGEQSASADRENRKILHVDGDNYQHRGNFWKKLINFGKAERLQDERIRSQLKYLKEELGFEFARVEVSFRDTDFYDLESAVDFILSTGAGVWIMLDCTDKDTEESAAYYRNMLQFMTERYGGAVQFFWFEIVYRGDMRKYAVLNKRVCDITESYALVRKPVGPSLVVQDDAVQLRKYIEAFREELPGIITIACSGGTTLLEKKCDLIYEILSEYKWYPEIYITDWNDIDAGRNYLNDSCYRGANLLQSFLKVYGKITAAALAVPIDILADRRAGKSITVGLPGLLCGQGIEKPAFYAYRFSNHLESGFSCSDQNSVVTVSSGKSFEIICHNASKLSYEYYLKRSMGKEDVSIAGFFEENAVLHLEFHFKNLPDCEYMLKTRVINADNGSVQDEWRKVGYDSTRYVGSDEIRYLKGHSFPALTGEKLQTKDGKLIVHCDLAVNEIRHLHLIRLRK